MEYLISKTEIRRRNSAFNSLIISSMAAFLLSGIFFWPDRAKLWTWLLSSLLIIFIFFKIFIVLFFKSFLKTKIILSDKYLERTTQKSHDKVLLTSIRRLVVVKTTRNKIRELRIYSERNNLIIDGLENFNDFKDELLKKCKIECAQINEIIDYDHPLFYIILGTILGFITVISMKGLTRANATTVTIIYYSIAVYAIIVGIYFIINKPITKRYAAKHNIIDYIWGLLFLLSGIAIFILSRRF